MSPDKEKELVSIKLVLIRNKGHPKKKPARN